MKRLTGPKWGIRFTIALMAATSCFASSKASTLIDRATGAINGAIYQLDIDENQTLLRLPLSQSSNNAKAIYRNIFFYELKVLCISRCSSNVLYSERTLDSPLASFRISDDSPYFITTWTSGSAYRIRLYSIAGNRVKKILEVGSLDAPQINLSRHDLLNIQVANPDLQSNIILPAGVLLWNFLGNKDIIISKQQQ